MKKIIGFVMLSLVFLSACRKTDLVNAPIDESQWLQKERGIVVFSDYDCDYIVIETAKGYTVAENWSFRATQGEVLYGDFSYYGTRSIYNRSRGNLMTVNIRDIWLSYYQAQDQINWYCSQ
jgi:major membrane immunogen (membrane-anchored lipoprotein)